MRIVIGSVVKGFALKSAIKQWLEKAGHTVTDVGCQDTAVFVKFPSVAERAILLKLGEETTEEQSRGESIDLILQLL